MVLPSRIYNVIFLFNMLTTIDKCINVCDSDNRGILVGEMYLYIFLYAGKRCHIFGKNSNDLQHLSDGLHDATMNMDWNINVSNSKIVVFNRKNGMDN